MDEVLGGRFQSHTGLVTAIVRAMFSYPSLPSKPVLTRGLSELQIGFDGASDLVLADIHPRLPAVLGLLDGCHALTAVRELSRQWGVPPTQLDWTLQTLSDAGLLVEGDPRERRLLPSGHRVRLLGAGRLGKAVAELLIGSGVSSVHVVDNEPVDPELYPAAGASGSQADALVGAVSAPSDRLKVANHWSKPEESTPDLTIFASDLLECDRVAAGGLTRADQPQLFLRARPQGVVVGPLVVPGHSACLHCTDLTRRDVDHAWPHLLAQLLRARVPLSPVATSWGASVAAVQALAFLNGSLPETYGGTLEMSAADYVTRWRSWPMHAQCGCAWT